MVDGRTEMSRCCCREKDTGFTLIELLIAIFIFAIVISSVYGAYRTTFRTIHSAESYLTVSRNGRVAIQRITDDLKSIVSGPGGEFRGERHDLAGTRGDSLTFISSSHLSLSKKDGPAGYAVIAFSAQRNEQSGLIDLYRSDRVLVPAAKQEENEPSREILCEGLQAVTFSYTDEDGREIDEWRSDEGRPAPEEGDAPPEPLLPALVYVKLVFAQSIDSKDRTVFKTAVALPQNAELKKKR